MYTRMLVPLDGSAFAEHAVPVAVALARRRRPAAAVIDLVHVRPPRASAANAPRHDARLDEDIQRRTHDRIAGLADRLSREEGSPTKAVVLHGDVTDAIHAYVATSGAEIVVMTTHGRGGFSRAWLGSVADALVRRLTIPLLLVRPDTEGTPGVREPIFRRVLVPLDGSSRAQAILDRVLALGVPDGTELLLLTIVTTRGTVDPFPGLTSMLDTEELAHRAEEEKVRAGAHLEQVAGSLHGSGARVTIHVVAHDGVASGILGFARESAVDIIALSTRVRSRTERLLLGSVADKVLRGATVPVLVHGPNVDSAAASLGETHAGVAHRSTQRFTLRGEPI